MFLHWCFLSDHMLEPFQKNFAVRIDVPIATHFQSATCRVVSLGPIAVMCLSGATTVTDLDHFDACHDLLSRSYKQLGTVTVMTGGFLKVSSRVIDRAAQMALKYKGDRRAHV